jgi:hypothetical protein
LHTKKEKGVPAAVFSQFQWLILTLVRIGHVFAIRTITAVRFTALSNAPYL